ncbi:MAG: amino acid ABC transporter permease [Mycobacterium sp.]|nr:amino acid ABC transporter permease [Mycobacterium sp.]
MSHLDVADAGRRIRWAQWVARIVVTFVAIEVLHFLVTNPTFEWDVVWQWFRAPSVVRALWTTLWLSAVSMLIGLMLGAALAAMKMANNRLGGAVADLYIWLFRGTPLLVQLIFWFNLAAPLPQISIGIPLGGPKLGTWDTNTLITPLTAAILGLALNEAAYMAEIIRGGLLSVDHGQHDAAKAFGMSPARTLWRVVLPQAMRSIIPPTGNQLISMVKATAMVSVIAMSDLLYTVQSVYNRTFQTIPLLLVAVLWYLIVTSMLNVIQSFLEDYFGRSSTGTGSFAGAVKRWWTDLRRGRIAPTRAIEWNQR